MPTIRTAYGPKLRVQLDCTPDGAGRTKQSFKDECDINNIMLRFAKTGTIEFTNKNEPRYADVTGMDYTAFRNAIAGANSMFAELPAKLRNRFDNDPAKFLDFVQDDRNINEARDLGLLKPQAATAPQGATPPAPAPSGAPTTSPKATTT